MALAAVTLDDKYTVESGIPERQLLGRRSDNGHRDTRRRDPLAGAIEQLRRRVDPADPIDRCAIEGQVQS